MRKLVYLLPALLFLTLSACKQDQKTAAGAANGAEPKPGASALTLSGHWIALDFCARAGKYGSVLAAMNNGHKPYAYALTFLPSQLDSALAFPGPDGRYVPLRAEEDTVQIVNAREKGPIYLVYSSQGDQSMTMFDPAPSGTQMDRFIKSRGSAKDGYTAFVTALSHHLFNGTFTLLGKKAAAEQKIAFAPDGALRNFPGYDQYEVCVEGDCYVAGQAIDVVRLSNSKAENSAKAFGYRYSGQNDTLYLYNLNGNAVGTLAYSLLRKKAE
jgi:hypothetical protein